MKKQALLRLSDGVLLVYPLVMAGSLILFYFYVLFPQFNFKGVHALKNKKPQEALLYFFKDLEKKSLNPWSHLNVALAYDANQQSLKSLQAYQVVSSQFKDAPQFFSYFNQGELQGRLGDIPKALHNYQEALEFGLKQKEIKENIELLFQKQKNSSSQDKQKQDEDDNSSKKEEGSSKEDSNKDNSQNSKEDAEDSSKNSSSDQNQVEKQKENLDTSNAEEPVEGLTQKQAEFILKAIEQNETEVRAKTFQKKSQYGDKDGKDW